jgi:hypothetical protein
MTFIVDTAGEKLYTLPKVDAESVPPLNDAARYFGQAISTQRKIVMDKSLKGAEPTKKKNTKKKGANKKDNTRKAAPKNEQPAKKQT